MYKQLTLVLVFAAALAVPAQAQVQGGQVGVGVRVHLYDQPPARCHAKIERPLFLKAERKRRRGGEIVYFIDPSSDGAAQIEVVTHFLRSEPVVQAQYDTVWLMGDSGKRIRASFEAVIDMAKQEDGNYKVLVGGHLRPVRALPPGGYTFIVPLVLGCE